MLPLAILSQMNDVVTVKTIVTVDAYGTRVLSAGTVSRGRLEYGDKRMTATNGEQMVSSMQLYMPDIPGLTSEGEVTLPDGSTPRIRSIARKTWPNGSKHLEIGF